ncbi:MAG: mechanosensitive ion channel family protein [Rhodocyclaceae bacterium]|nr:mechanosensitive ion channel family protein [Rhodocyclaceae bacterium]
MNALSGWLEAFSPAEGVLIVANLLLIAFSRPLVRALSRATTSEESLSGKLHFFRAANVLVVGLVVFSNAVLPVVSHSWMTRLLGAVLVAFLGYLSAHVANYLIKRRFGRMREVNGVQTWTDTYNVRILSLLSSVFLFVMVLIAEVRILGFDSLLEAGGVIGFIGVMLALTQGAWAPDIIGGLVILNSRLVEEGDVIEIHPGETILGIVYKTKIFHTELLNLANNHRIMVGNAALRGMIIHNLSKFASARGLREAIVLKVGYDTDEAAVRGLVDATFEQLCRATDCGVEGKYPPELRATEAGDFAVEWTVDYHTKDIRHLLTTRQTVLGTLIAEAGRRGIALATPRLHVVQAPDPDS